MKKLSHVFIILAFVLSHIMCIVVAYSYSYMLCQIEHAGNSAPASISFLYAIPFVLAISVCVILSLVFNKKSKR